jgi:hypothetical protein
MIAAGGGLGLTVTAGRPAEGPATPSPPLDGESTPVRSRLPGRLPRPSKNLRLSGLSKKDTAHGVHTHLFSIPGGQRSRSFASAGSSWRKWGSRFPGRRSFAGSWRGPGADCPQVQSEEAYCHQGLVEEVEAECCHSGKAPLDNDRLFSTCLLQIFIVGRQHRGSWGTGRMFCAEAIFEEFLK